MGSHWKRTLFFLATFCLLVGRLDAQPWRRDVSNNQSVRITYDGRIYLRHPNFDVALNGIPTLPGYVEDDRARVIFRNNQGSFWDGNRFFLSPSYRYGLVTRNDRTQHYIGQWRGQWPPVDGMEPVPTARPGVTETVGNLPTSGIPLALVPDRSPLPLPNLPPMPYPPKKPLAKRPPAPPTKTVEEPQNDAFLEPAPKKLK